MASASRTFRARFEGEPEVVAWAPGRVNLIGEHTDTSHLPVLPMAIDRGVEVVAACRSRPGIEAGSGLSAEAVEFDWGSAAGEDRRAGQNQPDLAPYLRGVMRELAGMARGPDSTGTQRQVGRSFGLRPDSAGAVASDSRERPYRPSDRIGARPIRWGARAHYGQD